MVSKMHAQVNFTQYCHHVLLDLVMLLHKQVNFTQYCHHVLLGKK